MERKKKILANMQGNLIFPWLNNISRREYEGKQYFSLRAYHATILIAYWIRNRAENFFTFPI